MGSSNEIVLIEDDLYVSMRGLTSYKNDKNKSISVQTLRNRIHEFTKGKSKNWVCSRKHANGITKWWFLYKSIPFRTKKRWNLPKHEELLKQAIPFEDLLAPISKDEYSISFQLRAAAVMDHPRFSFEYDELAIGSKKQLQFSKTHAVFVKLLELKRQKNNLRELFEAYKEIAPYESLSFTTNKFEYFCKKLLKAEKNGIPFTIVHGTIGSESNNLKLDEINKRKIRYWYRQKYSFRKVTNKLNLFRQAQGLDPVHQRTVEVYLHEKRVKNYLLEDKNGKSDFKHKVLGYYDRYVDGVGGVWEIDGRRFPFAIIEDDNIPKPVFYCYVIVVDAFSKRIIGSCLSPSEDRYAISTALFSAAQNTGHLPKCLIHDNHGPYRTQDIELLRLKAIEMGVVWSATRPYEPRGKANVESSFNRFNKVTFRNKPGFTGESIVSTYVDSRPSREQMDKILRNSTYSWESAYRLLLECIVEFNHEPIDKKISPTELFAVNNANAQVSAGQIKLEPSRLAFLFYSKRASVVQKGEIRIQIDNEKYRYELSTKNAVELYQVPVDFYYHSSNLLFGYLFYRDTSDFICKVVHKRKINENKGNRPQKEQAYVKRKSQEKRTFMVGMRSKNEADDQHALELASEFDYKRMSSNKDTLLKAEMNSLLSMAGFSKVHEVEINNDQSNKIDVKLRASKSKGKLKPLE